MKAKITIVPGSTFERQRIHIFGFLLLFLLLGIALWTIGATVTHAQDQTTNTNQSESSSNEITPQLEEKNTNVDDTDQMQNDAPQEKETISLEEAREQFLKIYNRAKDRSQDMTEEEKRELVSAGKIFTQTLISQLLETVELIVTNAGNMTFISDTEQQTFIHRMNEIKEMLQQENLTLEGIREYSDVREIAGKLRPTIQEMRVMLKKQKLLSVLQSLQAFSNKTEAMITWFNETGGEDMKNETNDEALAQLGIVKKSLSTQWNTLRYIQSIFEAKIQMVSTFEEVVILETYVAFTERGMKEISELITQIHSLLFVISNSTSAR
ncbi:MAG: hypothetical protein A3B74_04880 [Candidatus Kerfeldbacteria bacterium RIFCSPHIGHO2_02_FULL_42_14]|uniref:Uncharacterized protein n=1 Tax=Candidatus Kerfeldbacteria bacterium RIFCSPHIGHO2_02_FULL_42_14 TaxID=1798540 RepID=A0A1G2AQ45_9BACT|nr:MAG: hypothetical protein A3B74_04880 [Candidatus Kerfeldbacteria bacterium RIFCSPHIGHO2_02_FULL_42_14]OGY81055.1 MAG: hypothetical protein A3E60_03600 [Candidatus Kerfeldbacteria bacterium RIFCSPHIGHO2_12_FULL_42_13]OGY84873.1 MAG: hypothetical protein A3I91_05245 [Candidatus Kerfeldbacteria bacterium RIFCSPLOWO2_02_FULL_42_19]OGY86786.1 MAG: hypothetical protein A3G01_02545 [Candidatus Kerfeldbacteria bacterium RIFCSPLOWO2_12_FULL_43_9]